MKRLISLAITFVVLCNVLCGCSEEKETPITYSPWLNGEWKSVSVAGYCYYPLSLGEDVADGLVGRTYDFTAMQEEGVVGGALPIRDTTTQYFFWPQFPYCLEELGLEGSYYVILHFENENSSEHPCIYVKSRNEMLLTEAQTGVYNIQRIAGSDLC